MRFPIKSQLLYQLSYRGNILYTNALQKSHFGIVYRLCTLQVRDDKNTDCGHKGGRRILQRHSRPNLSKDGKQRSFPKVPNLLQYVSTGIIYGEVAVDVSGGMKVVESWRFEIPFSSAAFSSNPSL